MPFETFKAWFWQEHEREKWLAQVNAAWYKQEMVRGKYCGTSEAAEKEEVFRRRYESLLNYEKQLHDMFNHYETHVLQGDTNPER